jgi:hypothetical protein
MSDAAKTTKLAGSERGAVSLHVWSTVHEPRVHILSLSASVAHMVVTLKSQDTLREMLTFIETHRGAVKAEWLEIGTFAASAVGVYTDREGVSLICDGHSTGDFPESFGIRFADALLDSLCQALTDVVQTVSDASRQT